VSVYDLSCLYWVYLSMGDVWDEAVLDLMETHLLANINKEILL